MKAVLSLQFESERELADVVARLTGSTVEHKVVLEPACAKCDVTEAEVITPPLAERTETTATPTPDPVKKPRQRRSDAGQPRGAYKTETTIEERNAAARASVGQPAAAAADEVSGGATGAVAQKPVQPAAAADPNKKLTRDDARAALKAIVDCKGLGQLAAIQHLQEHGVVQISLLPEAMYAEFIKKAQAKVSAMPAA
jgi:hypothetical protein